MWGVKSPTNCKLWGTHVVVAAAAAAAEAGIYPLLIRRFLCGLLGPVTLTVNTSLHPVLLSVGGVSWGGEGWGWGYFPFFRIMES